MAKDFGRVSRRHYITGYNVVISAGLADNIEFVLQDPCNTLSDPCRAKAILVKAYKDYLLDNGVTPVAADTACKTLCCPCDMGGADVSFYAYTYTLSFATTAVGAPATALTVFVPLPLPCDNVFEEVAYTTSAP